ncbi:MAG TPA: hypothetical protein VE959_02090 [Bryobacteraceae bacterium]|nr:hypothetical protein [Bryobacteraceae bacterium]
MGAEGDGGESRLFFLFFFFSGFCSLVYQVVWLRVAMAAFGVTTPLISIVLSVFMAGLALGSWGGGRLVRRSGKRPAAFFVRVYGATELAIGVSGLVVVRLLGAGRGLLAGSWGSAGHYLASGSWIALVMLPFCTCMGATFPLAMAGIRRARSFSFLYVANVLGATAGTLGSAFVFIELMGFRKTVWLAAGLNAMVAVAAFAFAPGAAGPANESRRPEQAAEKGATDGWLPALLFVSGLASLGMEVVWTRQFVPFMGPVVYTFAAMLAVYLAATAAGSRIYRIRVRRKSTDRRNLALAAGCCALLPLLAADPEISLPHRVIVGALRVLAGVGAFCGVLGFLTPMLVDRWSGGDADRAGRAYAVNAVGCILGPLLAGFVLLPEFGERWTLVLLAVPFFVFGLGGARWLLAGSVALSVVLVGATRDFETLYPDAEVRRDHTATVIAAGAGMNKMLLINGVGITSLTPITKMMVHLPLAWLERPPRKVLVVCFGMGTSFRSALAWGAEVTTVDLVPSVPPLFGFFHSDGVALLGSPRARVVIDDGRRFLERTAEVFDAIVVDPPPPVEAAGSSLLYSAEFYEAAKRRLRPGGMLAQWLPQGERIVVSSIAQALRREFSDIRVFPPVEAHGLHFLASNGAMARNSGAELAARVPPGAAGDMLEWGPAATVEAQFELMLRGEMTLDTVIDADRGAPALTDDRPVNEYYFLRRLGRGAAYFVR